MIFSTFVVANDYRQQLFDPFVQSKSFGKAKYLRLDSRSVMRATGRLYWIYWVKLMLAKKVVLSDDEGVVILERYKALRFKSIIFFAWNDNDEVKDWNLKVIRAASRLQIVFLIPEPVKESKARIGLPSYHLRPPVVVTSELGKKDFSQTMFFTSEVEISPDFLRKEGRLDKRTWAIAQKFFEVSPINPQDHEILELQNNEERIPLYQIHWIIRNRVRYLYVKRLKEVFGNRFILAGTEWKRFGIDALPSDHDPEKRRLQYHRSKVCLDFLSKTSSCAQYPRSAEIVSHSYGMLQMKTDDSAEFFGDQLPLRAFVHIEDLLNKIDFMMKLETGAYIEKGLALRSRLAKLTNKFNKNSLDGVFLNSNKSGLEAQVDHAI